MIRSWNLVQGEVDQTILIKKEQKGAKWVRDDEP